MLSDLVIWCDNSYNIRVCTVCALTKMAPSSRKYYLEELFRWLLSPRGDKICILFILYHLPMNVENKGHHVQMYYAIKVHIVTPII